MLDKEFHLVLRSAPVRYTVAVGLFIVAVVVRFGVLPPDAAAAYFTFYPAAIFAFYYFGVGPGVLLVLLASAAGLYVNTAGHWAWSLDSRSGLDTGAFVVSALLTAWIVQRLVRTSEELTTTMQQLRELSIDQHAMLDTDLIGIAKLRGREIAWANRALGRMFGYPREELLGSTTCKLYESEAAYAAFGEAAYPVVRSGGAYRAQQRMRRKDGSTFWVEFNGLRLSDADSLWLLQDITVLKEHQQKIEEMAFHDALTGLPNRALLADRLGQLVSLCGRLHNLVAVCFIDLDGFKGVNDRLGHEAGDVLLKELARRLQACVRGNDTVARLGGDEFIVLLSPLQSVDECRTILQRVAALLQQPVDLGGDVPCRVSASIGVAMFPQDGCLPAALIARADAAMYVAKRSGGGRIEFAAPAPSHPVASPAPAAGATIRTAKAPED